jgi:hypothetical protein
MTVVEIVHFVAPAKAGAAKLSKGSRAASGPGLRRGDAR